MKLYFLFPLFFLIMINCKIKLKDLFKEGNLKGEKVMIEMGLDKKDIWTKKDCQQFSLKLFDKGDNNERQQTFNEQIVKTYMRKLPNNLKKEELYKHINYEDFIVAIQQTVREQFGPEHVKEVTKALLEMENEDEEENNNKKNNTKEDVIDMDEIDKDL